LYFLVEGRQATPAVLLMIWLDRVVPVTLLFVVAIALVAQVVMAPATED
jgi:hypothetical protein